MKNIFTSTGKGMFSRLMKVGPLLIGGLFISLAGVNAQSTTPPNGYCQPSHNNMNNDGCANNWGFHFLGVELSTGFNQSVSCNTSTVYRYWNNLGNIANFSQGADYTLTLQTASTTYTTGVGAWIDFNQDGQFSANEYLGGSQGTNAPYHTLNFSLSCNALPGNTIMRVRCDYNTTVANSRGCGTTQNNYGETMDYMITINGSANPTANFTVPDTIYTSSPAMFANYNPTGYISHEWDVLNQGNSPDATTTNFEYTFPSAGNYQVKLTSTNCQGSAIETKNITVVDPTSAPQVNFVVSENEVVYDGSTPIFVDFYDLSQYGPTQWNWIMTPDFINGAPYIWSQGSSFSRNPQAFFYDVEEYSVCLAAGNAAGWDTVCKTGYIKILDPAGSGGSGGPFENTMGQQLGSSLDSGVIYDSGGPNADYSNNEYNTFTIAPCGGEEVTLYFDQFDIENNFDYLRIFNGPSTASPQIGNFTSTNAPASITATSGTMTLLFTSDASVPYPGFVARWSSRLANDGAPNADFDLPDTIYSCSGGNDVVFDNLSTGVLPGQAEYDWIFDYDPNVQYPGGYSDATADNPTWNYTSAGVYNVRMVLSSCEGNDTMVKTMVIATTSNNPIVDFKSSERIVKVNSTVTFTEDATAACGFEWEVFPATYELENGTQLDDREIVVKFTAPGSYSIKLIAENDNGQTVEHKTNHVDVISYCNPVAAIPNVADVGINRVQFETIDNESASTSASGYQDFSEDFSVNLTLGEDYAVTVTRNSNVNLVDRKVWIDYNRDGDFEDVNELVASETGSSNRAFNGTFTIPGIDDVIIGETRMRVGSALSGTNLSGCGPTQVGEYEDYTIFLVLDDMPPVINIIGGDTSVELNSVYNDRGATATDNIEGSISVTSTNGVDMTQAGIYFVCYDAMDKSGNPAPTSCRRVTVVEDLTVPTLTVNGADPLLWSVLVPYVDPSATAIDMPSGNNMDAFIQMSGTVDVNTVGDYIITYTVEDDYGNAAMETRTVQVRDTTAPMINANATYEVQVGQPFKRPFDATDNFDMQVEPTIISGSVNTSARGTYVVEYGVMDASGNMGSNVTVTYEVDDYTAPQIYFTPGTQTVVVDVFDVNWNKKPGMQVTATDNYYSSVDLKTELPAGFSIDEIGTYVITYRATDGSGNETTWERTLVVVDREKPLVIANPITISRWMTGYDFMEGITVKDNYYTPQDFMAPFANDCELLIIRNNVDFNYPGLYQVTYVAIDGSGNRSEEVTRLVSVMEENATGIADQDLANSIQVYPNPNNGQFTLEINAVLADDATIELINVQGKAIANLSDKDLVNGKMNVEMTSLTPGVYFVRVSDGSRVATKRLVIAGR